MIEFGGPSLYFCTIGEDGKFDATMQMEFGDAAWHKIPPASRVVPPRTDLCHFRMIGDLPTGRILGDLSSFLPLDNQGAVLRRGTAGLDD